MSSVPRFYLPPIGNLGNRLWVSVAPKRTPVLNAVSGVFEFFATLDRNYVLGVAERHELDRKLDEAIEAMGRPAGDVQLHPNHLTITPSSVSTFLDVDTGLKTGG
jgi:hypothetical protein